MRGMFCKSGLFSRSGFLDMWNMLPGIFLYFDFQMLKLGKVDICVNMFNLSAIPALSVRCSLPSGNPKSGFWLLCHWNHLCQRWFHWPNFPEMHSWIHRKLDNHLKCLLRKLIFCVLDGPLCRISWKFGQWDHLWERWIHWQISWKCVNGFQIKSLNFVMRDPIKSGGNPCGN